MGTEMLLSRVQREVTRDTVSTGEFEVDRAPVTNARYGVFVESADHRAPAYWPDDACPPSMANHPVVGIDYFDAVAFARWAGGRLPTELEWVLAAAPKEPAAYAWGDAFDSERCNTFRSGHKGTTPVDAYAEGASAHGCLDMCGNVWEMTASADKEHANTIIVKGGSWYDYPVHAKLDANFHAPIHRVGRTVGFRLVYGGAERHPEFLESDLIDACIDYRARTAEREVEEPIEEFDFGALRDDLELKHGIALVSLAEMEPVTDTGEDVVEAALDWFDRAEQSEPEVFYDDAGADNAKDNAQALDRALEFYLRMHAFVSERPRILFGAVGAAILLAATTLWASVREPDSMRREASAMLSSAHESAPGFAAAAPSRPRSARPDPRAEMRRVVTDLARGRSNERSLALRVLLARGESSRAAITEALSRTTDPDEELRLRYALAALDEKKGGSGRTVPVTVLPAQGLVLVCESFGSAERRCLQELRRFGRASQRDVHLVLSGTKNFAAWLEEHVDQLGAVYVAWDPERNFARLHKVSGKTAVLGLRSDGRAAFVLPGTPSHTRIGDQLRALN